MSASFFSTRLAPASSVIRSGFVFRMSFLSGRAFAIRVRKAMGKDLFSSNAFGMPELS